MQYELKFNFSTIKVNRDGSIRGRNGAAICIISSDYLLDELKNKTDELKVIAYNSLVDNAKVKKMGTIDSIDIVNLTAY